MSDVDPRQYDAFAEQFEAHAEAAPYNAMYDRPAVLDLAGDVHGLRVFDAGCGPGFYVAELLARGATVIGCDASSRMVDLARRRVGERADLRVQSLDEPLEWVADASVDLVLSALVYHYLNDRPAFLHEVQRVLRPGGTLVISTHHPTTDWLRLGGSYFANEPVTETWSQGWEVAAWRLPLTDLCAEFAEAGFLIERRVEARPSPEMAVSFPTTYARLSTEPAFVLFRLVPDPRRRT